MIAKEIRERIHATVMARLDSDPERRSEALADFLALSLPDMDESSARSLAGLVPELSRGLYAKWIDIFADRLLATIPQNQLEDLCDGTEENNAAMCLTYLMFMESSRMEKQVAEDLAALDSRRDPNNKADGPDGPNATGGQMERDAQCDALAMYLRFRLRQKNGGGNAS